MIKIQIIPIFSRTAILLNFRDDFIPFDNKAAMKITLKIANKLTYVPCAGLKGPERK